MRLLTLSKLLVFGGTAAWATRRFLRQAPSRAREAEPVDFGPDPGDPVQNLDEVTHMHVADYDVDAIDAADAEAAQDLALLESDLDESALELDTPSETTIDAQNDAALETGELYGVHTASAAAHAQLDDGDDSFDDGQNWLEALETSAVEYGAEPEHEIDVIDDMDTAPHPSDTRDTPVADRGSGGPGGV